MVPVDARSLYIRNQIHHVYADTCTLILEPFSGYLTVGDARQMQHGLNGFNSTVESGALTGRCSLAHAVNQLELFHLLRHVIRRAMHAGAKVTRQGAQMSPLLIHLGVIPGHWNQLSHVLTWAVSLLLNIRNNATWHIQLIW